MRKIQVFSFSESCIEESMGNLFDEYEPWAALILLKNFLAEFLVKFIPLSFELIINIEEFPIDIFISFCHYLVYSVRISFDIIV